MSDIQGITIRKAAHRGHADHGWLDSFHSFSFADYYDANHMGFRSLRVINEDTVAGGKGFGAHPHRDMEILTYVITGALKHKDSMGHESVIKSGDVQKITAGKGIVHSEFNASLSEPVHFLQIWVIPQQKDLEPSYQQFLLSKPDPQHPLFLIGSPQKTEHVVHFNQDVLVFRGDLAAGKGCDHALKASRAAWVQVVHGQLMVNGLELSGGDGAAIEGISSIAMNAKQDAHFLLFDLK